MKELHEALRKAYESKNKPAQWQQYINLGDACLEKKEWRLAMAYYNFADALNYNSQKACLKIAVAEAAFVQKVLGVSSSQNRINHSYSYRAKLREQLQDIRHKTTRALKQPTFIEKTFRELNGNLRNFVHNLWQECLKDLVAQYPQSTQSLNPSSRHALMVIPPINSRSLW